MRILLPLLLCLLPLPAAERVLLLSLDGLGYKILSQDPAARELTVLHRMGRHGTMIPLRTTFPSKTSAGHAAIFTGKWSGENGVFSNTNPLAPRAAHELRESVVGFRSDSLTAEPIWTAAARQGVRTVAYQATQAYPFTKLSAGLDLPRPPVVINGYQTRLLAPHRVVRAGDLVRQPDGSYLWQDGPLSFRIERQGKRALKITHGGHHVVVPARGFSPMLRVEDSGAYFRLFAITANDFLLYRTSIHELGVAGFDGATLLAETGAFIGNTPTQLYRQGGFGKTLTQGGDGIAEQRYLECFALVTRQMTRQMLWLDQRLEPGLFVGYYPQVDDLEHVFYGLSQTGQRSVDAVRRQAYRLLNRELGRLLRRFRHVVVTSDHGMAPATHQLRMGVLLRELGWGPERALANASCIYLNTADWRHGVIPLAEAEQERERLAQALGRHRLITRVYRHAELPAFGLAGDRQPDACFDVAPLHYPSEAAEGELTSPYATAQGEHGFDPTREDMQAILVTTRAGVRMGDVTGLFALVLSLR